MTTVNRTRQERIEHLLSYIQDQSNSFRNRSEAAEDLINIRLDGKRSWKGLDHPELTDKGIRLMAREGRSGGAGTNEHTGPLEQETALETVLQPNAARIARMFFTQEQWAKLEAHRARNDTNWDDLEFTEEEIALIESHLND